MSANTNTDIWLAGAFAAFSVDLLVYPLDTLKTRLQAENYKQLYKLPNGSTNRSLFRGLYQGVGSIILITLPSSGAFFTAYEGFKTILKSEAVMPPNSTIYLPEPAIHAVASIGAELVSCAILTPAEVLKQNAQMMSASGGRSSSLRVFQQFKKHPTKLWRGYTALAARNLPYTGLQFPLFEYLKKDFLKRREVSKGGKPVDGIAERALITAMSAGIAGSGAAWITTPIDVVKTRIMLAASTDDPVDNRPKQRGMLFEGIQGNRKSGFTVAAEVFKKEGIQGLFRGALLRAAWTTFGSGLYLGIYEGGRFYLESTRKEKDDDSDHVMERDWSKVKVGVQGSRSHATIRKSGWQDD
ncbi:hypothetical protein B0A52_02384 [Exophiala mesophila]|uniref:Mitochondrial thiamine pyrophosphate carrier 1 n=1 Tax=Exophiala mesophila TaxID=212818 RepID=A0A438NBV0_EXOME|nr:hypothetical protein B0A52_02384 [Exophiala mesophila]